MKGARRTVKGLLFACVMFMSICWVSAQDGTYSGVCPNGAPAREERFCHFFVRFDSDVNSQLDTRIADALGVRSAAETRSIGLIIAIDKYPWIPNADISAAAIDAERLRDFLIREQKFDEVIVLRNEEATADTINYFMEDYLVNRASEFAKKARLFIAFSGHGRFGTTDATADTQAAFILSAARDVNGYQDIYKMQGFATDVAALANRYFHVLTMINTCYGGGFFTTGAVGGNPDAFSKPGSYALTAGSDKDVVVSIDPTRGSVFFDQFISGVSTGTADPQYVRAYGIVDGAGSANYLGLTRTNALLTYLTTQYGVIERNRKRVTPGFSLNEPWLGPAQPDVARGGFFFLSDENHSSAQRSPDMSSSPLAGRADLPQRTGEERGVVQRGRVQPILVALRNVALNPTVSQMATSPALPAAPRLEAVPPGPISSIPGRPDIKVFKAPEIYPVKGLDISSQDREVDLNRVKKSFDPTFLYLRAVGWKGVDESFRGNLKAAKSLGFDYGVYLKFDFLPLSLRPVGSSETSIPTGRRRLACGRRNR